MIDGRYETRSLIGRGGYGAVYRAHQGRVDRDVAVSSRSRVRPRRSSGATPPPELLRLIARLLAKAPGDRPESAETVCTALEAIERTLTDTPQASLLVPANEVGDLAALDRLSVSP